MNAALAVRTALEREGVDAPVAALVASAFGDGGADTPATGLARLGAALLRAAYVFDPGAKIGENVGSVLATMSQDDLCAACAVLDDAKLQTLDAMASWTAFDREFQAKAAAA